MRTLYHGSRVTVEQPEIRIQKFHKDFYWGCLLYTSDAAAQNMRRRPPAGLHGSAAVS